MRAKTLSVLGLSVLLLCGCTPAESTPPPQSAPPVIGSATGGPGLTSIEKLSSTTPKISVEVTCVGTGILALNISKVGSIEAPCREEGATPRGQALFDVSHIDGTFAVDIDAGEGQSWELKVSESNKIT